MHRHFCIVVYNVCITDISKNSGMPFGVVAHYIKFDDEGVVQELLVPVQALKLSRLRRGRACYESFISQQLAHGLGWQIDKYWC